MSGLGLGLNMSSSIHEVLVRSSLANCLLPKDWHGEQPLGLADMTGPTFDKVTFGTKSFPSMFPQTAMSKYLSSLVMQNIEVFSVAIPSTLILPIESLSYRSP